MTDVASKKDVDQIRYELNNVKKEAVDYMHKAEFDTRLQNTTNLLMDKLDSQRKQTDARFIKVQ